jgi:nitroimidazol reductase NimA-like FMN-containing flavoprotein (pyridoxamine 5'-phosphate oxidase superfamily)
VTAADAPSPRTRVRRLPKRAAYDAATVAAVLDAGMVAHLGFVVDGQPYVIPILHARVGDAVYVHGSPAGRAVRVLAAGAPACLTVTHLDGLVLARSAFHHSVNYRSVVVLGQAASVTEPAEKLRALEALVDRLTPGRRSARRTTVS